MKLTFTTLDVFTTTRYTGNPVSIISVPADLKRTLTQTQKQAIAKEFNLSEIIFLHLPSPTAAEATERQIDIFTSHAEVPFAGHPTIGSAFYILHVLKEKHVKTLITKAGRIPIEETEEGGVKAEIPFNFHVHSVTFPSTLNVDTQHPTTSIVKGMSFIFVRLPDLPILAKADTQGNINGYTYDPSKLDDGWQQGLVGTMYFVPQGVDEKGRKKYRTRMFGTREDPGTGSASSALGCFLAVTEGEEGINVFAFKQGVEMGRMNEILVEVEREGGVVKRVLLSGKAVEVMEGILEV
ncbi:hypothetical protein G7Y89_g2964 [Cudoniella acicularis]|uniref:Phenazine biosynthesis protein n=1 Tax=Cudoniella acicularis TaxID=354080 RepID=A0A8H4RTJ1_9HELO|nr:hypothetical protein G7Y89_g2964 [Cudoniella acicularis]